MYWRSKIRSKIPHSWRRIKKFRDEGDSFSKTLMPHAIQFVGILFLLRNDLSSPSRVRQPLKHTSRYERVESWKMTDCRAVPGKTGCTLVYEPEVHGTFGALLWRVRRRTWQQFRKREMPQRGGSKVGGPEWEQGTRKRRRRHTMRVQTSSLSGTPHKETKLTETFVLSPSWKQKVPARVGKALSDYDKPPLPGWFIDLFSWYYRAIEIQCSPYAQLIARLFYVISIGVEIVDDYDVNKLHRNCTVEWYRKFDVRVSFSFQKINCLKERLKHFDARGRLESAWIDRNDVIIILCIGVKLNQLKPNENVIPAPWENNCPGIAGLRQRAYISSARYF